VIIITIPLTLPEVTLVELMIWNSDHLCRCWWWSI